MQTTIDETTVESLEDQVDSYNQNQNRKDEENFALPMENNYFPLQTLNSISSSSSSSPSSSPPTGLNNKETRGLKRTKKSTIQEKLKKLEEFSLIVIIQLLFRGLGQVVFCNNAISGLFILIGLFIQDPMIGVGSVVALITNSGTAYWMGISKDRIKEGLYGYNGVLVGAALATFLVPKWQVSTFGGIVFASMVATCIHIAMIAFLSPYNLPVLTMPFNLSVAIFLYGCLDSNHFHVEFRGRIPDPSVVNDIHFSLSQSLLAIPKGVGQVFLCDHYLAGSFILCGIFIHSRISGMFACIGSTVGMMYGYALGVASSSIMTGLWGFNPVLASMAIGGFFFQLNLPTCFLAIFAGLTSSMLFAMWRNFFQVWGIPSGTFGFCTGAYIFLFMKDNIPFIKPIPLADITTPEGNLGLKGWPKIFPFLVLFPPSKKNKNIVDKTAHPFSSP